MSSAFHVDWAKQHHAEDLVITCSDSRIQRELHRWFGTFRIFPDLILLPGAAWQINNEETWLDVQDDITLLVRGHNIQRIWVANHVDCARYGIRFRDYRAELEFHEEQCRLAMNRLAAKYANTELLGRVLHREGWLDLETSLAAVA